MQKTYNPNQISYLIQFYGNANSIMTFISQNFMSICIMFFETMHPAMINVLRYTTYRYIKNSTLIPVSLSCGLLQHGNVLIHRSIYIITIETKTTTISSTIITTPQLTSQTFPPSHFTP